MKYGLGVLVCAVVSASAFAAEKPTDADLIASAMRAAPVSVSKNATIMTMEADGSMRTLRKGTNSFTCMPDNPATPGPDPMCVDASNTDPYATKPTAENHWIKTGPHIMIVGGDQAFYDAYPKSADPDTAAPYVMWAGTPYQHLMAPVK